MKSSNEKIYKILNKTISDDKSKVVEILRKSKVDVPSEPTKKDLFFIVNKEIIKGNGYLIYNLGRLIDEIYGTEPIEKMSNGSGDGFGAWMSNPDNQQLVGMGAGLLGNLFNTGGDNAAPPSNDTNNQMMMQFQLAQQQAQAEAARRRTEREEAAARRSQNTMIIGLVSIVVIGGAIAITMANKGKKA